MSLSVEDTEDNFNVPHCWKNDNEKTALQQFKERIKHLIKPEHDDYFLIKWLKARRFDVNKAEKMFLESMKFRDKMRVDKILKEYDPPEVLKKYLTGGFVGYDKEGSPVVVDLYGRLDMRGLMSSVKKTDFEKIKIQNSESVVKVWREQSEKLGRRIDGLTVIVDMEGIGTKSMWTPGIQMYLHLVRMLEDNYPEMMKRLFMVNAPKIFPFLFNLVKPLISEDMREKIHVFGGGFQSTLLKYIDADQLPEFLGGKQTDPDGNPRCLSKICQGGLVPKEYYLENTDFLDHMQKKTVANGDKLLIKQEVKHPSSILRWEFKTDDYDIIFGVIAKKNNKYEFIVPLSRVKSHVVAEDGSCICDEAGIYYLCFDNSFSWFRDKMVYYSCNVISSDGSDDKQQTENWHLLDTTLKPSDL